MRVTIIKDDGVIGVDGVFRSVDLSSMPDGVRVMQWEDTAGHSEYYDDAVANTLIATIDALQPFIDLWTAAAPPAPPAPTPAERIDAANARIAMAYQDAVEAMNAGTPAAEIASWPQQLAEARAWLLDPDTDIPWIKGAAVARSINVPTLVAMIIRNADATGAAYGAITGKWQDLRDAIVALGDEPTQAELDAIQW